MRVANRPKRNIGEQRMRFLRNFADGQHISLFEALRRSLDERFRRNEALLKAGAKTEAQAAAQRAKLEAVWQRALRASREEQQSRK